ncbi:MAG: urea ABC transporter ATP-binding protein UrtD [Deltaproteobacteria bacterium]|jgi:urea transport system ATP-binding protein|nr:urea ABC transporter ATP-binding protein UrtD [Deltaproteobacteria bacterium]
MAKIIAAPPVNPGLDPNYRIVSPKHSKPKLDLTTWETKSQRKLRYVLFLEELSVSFEGFKALDGLTMYLTDGELRCVIGPNGAGKTTLMDVITGHTKPDTGEAWYMDINLLENDEVFIARSGIGRKFQKPSVFDSLSVFQNLELSLKAKKTVLRTLTASLGQSDRDRLSFVLETVGLTNERASQAGTLSHGQKQWLEIGMLLAQEPKILLLDEPVAGMTPGEIERTTELLLSLEGTHSIILVEHDMEFVRSVARTVTVLHQGSVLAEGTMDEVAAHPGVIEAYLGGTVC